MSSRTLVYDSETGEWVEEEEYRRRESERRIVEMVAERVLRKLAEEYEIELDIDMKTGKARGRVRRRTPTSPAPPTPPAPPTRPA
jgi:hypothetical protein